MASAAVEYDLWRQTLADGEITTVYCVRHPLAETAVRVLHFPEPVGRHPRAALGIADDRLLAVACDGRRSRVDGGLSMRELAELMVELGAGSAINLDGGGSTALVTCSIGPTRPRTSPRRSRGRSSARSPSSRAGEPTTKRPPERPLRGRRGWSRRGARRA
jgi:hypothetical protein